jgi:hypothetical protein
VRLDEVDLTGKAPGRRLILLGLLALSFQLLQLIGELVWEVSVDARIADERVDVLSHQVWGHGHLLSARHDSGCCFMPS